MNSGIVKGFFKFYPGIFHKKRSFAGENRFLGWGIVFENQRGGRSVGSLPELEKIFTYFGKESKGGPLPAGPPFLFPHGFRGHPRNPQNGVMIKWDENKNAFVF